MSICKDEDILVEVTRDAVHYGDNIHEVTITGQLGDITHGVCGNLGDSNERIGWGYC